MNISSDQEHYTDVSHSMDSKREKQYHAMMAAFWAGIGIGLVSAAALFITWLLMH